MNLFISPHNDDAVLYGAYTLMREKPLVLTVTDSWLQFNRGEGVTADQRWAEDVKAMQILGCPAIRGGIRDDIVDEWMIKNLLEKFSGFDEVYAPMIIVNGNPHHNLVGKVAMEVFGDKLKRYVTYAKHSLYMAGEEEVKPTPEEIELKNKAFECYPSQLKINGPHFEAVRGRSEWFI